jgi:hypothetical protein
MSDALYISVYKYDARGRIIKEKRKVDVVDYIILYAYDSAD